MLLAKVVLSHIFYQLLDFTKTIIPLALMASESIAHSVFGLMDSEPIRAPGIIVKYTVQGT